MCTEISFGWLFEVDLLLQAENIWKEVGIGIAFRATTPSLVLPACFWSYEFLV